MKKAPGAGGLVWVSSFWACLTFARPLGSRGHPLARQRVKRSGLPEATSISGPSISAPVFAKPDRSSDVTGAVARLANAIAVARLANTIAVVSVGVVSV